MSPASATTAVLLILNCLLVSGTLCNLSSHPHWLVRAWDYPRVQIVILGWLIVGLYLLIRFFANESFALGIGPFLATALLLTAWHGFRIAPYTPMLPKQSASTPTSLLRLAPEDDNTIRIVITNVERENQRYELWMATMRQADPDVLLVVEPDRTWVEAIKEFAEQYPYRVVEPRDNWYGMVLLSRLPIVHSNVRYLVQEDVPSIDATLRMNGGTLVRCVGVHPRPPEPIRANDATARDAELSLWGTELADDSGPVIIGGDLNDVAWSQTTRLFLRTSGLLDPRRGRGFFNTFHADHWFMRFPLDHVFHSSHFTVSRMERLGYVGSDHFPILIDLRYTPAERDEHDAFESKESDAKKIELRLERAIEDNELTDVAF